MLLCPTHHSIVDQNETTFTTAALVEMKAAGEAPATVEPTSDQVRALIEGDVTIVGGSVITTIDQRGGQAAHQIFNLGPTPRTIARATVRDVHERLEAHTALSVGFAAFAGTPEAAHFKERLMEIFDGAGWPVGDVGEFTFFGSTTGAVLMIRRRGDEMLPSVRAAIDALHEITGETVALTVGELWPEFELVVQVWPQALSSP